VNFSFSTLTAESYQFLSRASNPYTEIRKTVYMPRQSDLLERVKRTGLVDTRIWVVDDSMMTRRVLSALVSSRWTVCGDADNGTTGVKKSHELKPDLVPLDLVRSLSLANCYFG
jgi:PleD family two-component response regulator